MDSTAYLSPILAFNLGAQHHLEAFMRPEKQQGSTDTALESRQNDDELSPFDPATSETGKDGCQQWVQTSHLSEPANKEGFGTMLQPGNFSDFQDL